MCVCLCEVEETFPACSHGYLWSPVVHSVNITSNHALLQYCQRVTVLKGQRLLHAPEGSRLESGRRGCGLCVRFDP